MYEELGIYCNCLLSAGVHSSVITGNCVNSSSLYCGLICAAGCTFKSNKYINVVTSGVGLTGVPVRMVVAMGELGGAMTLKWKP
jgi:hypothetical protein